MSFSNAFVPPPAFPPPSFPFPSFASSQNGAVLLQCPADDVMSIEPSLNANWLQMETVEEKCRPICECFSPNFLPSPAAPAAVSSPITFPPPPPLFTSSVFATVPPRICHTRTVSLQSSTATVIPSAYALFFRDIQREVRNHLGTAAGKETVNFGEVSRAVAKRWAEMNRTEKAAYRLRVQRLKRAQIKESALSRAKELLAKRWEKQ